MHLLVLALLMLFSFQARAQESMDEYKDIKPGIFLPPEAVVAPDDGRAENAIETVTMDDILKSYRDGNFDVVLKQLEPLAKNGHHQAEEILGLMYKNGRGVKQDFEQAVFWFSRAAEGSRPLAQHHLGILYYAGQGVVSDPTRALMWIYVALAHYPEGPEKERAIKDRDGIYAQLTRRDKERAKEMAREWLDKRGEGHLLSLPPN